MISSPELVPFEGYLASNLDTTVQTVALEGLSGSLQIIYNPVNNQLIINNALEINWLLSANIEMWETPVKTISNYPIDFEILPNHKVYINDYDPLEPNMAISVESINASCFIKDLSLVNSYNKISLQWEALLKRMPNDEVRLLLQGLQLSTAPA